MNNPSFLAIFSFIFILLGLYNINVGFRRMREARAGNQSLLWYKQINILTGIEYVLLALVFLLSAGIRGGVLPSSFSSIIIPFYLVVLLAAAVFAGLVIRQGMSNARRLRAQASQSMNNNNTSRASTPTNDTTSTRAQRAENMQRQRERRRNAAAARRRRAGRA